MGYLLFDFEIFPSRTSSDCIEVADERPRRHLSVREARGLASLTIRCGADLAVDLLLRLSSDIGPMPVSMFGFPILVGQTVMHR